MDKSDRRHQAKSNNANGLIHIDYRLHQLNGIQREQRIHNMCQNIARRSRDFLSWVHVFQQWRQLKKLCQLWRSFHYFRLLPLRHIYFELDDFIVKFYNSIDILPVQMWKSRLPGQLCWDDRWNHYHRPNDNEPWLNQYKLYPYYFLTCVFRAHSRYIKRFRHKASNWFRAILEINWVTWI